MCLRLGECNDRAGVEAVRQDLYNLADHLRAAQKFVERRRPPAELPWIAMMIRENGACEFVRRRHPQQSHTKLDDQPRLIVSYLLEQRIRQPLPSSVAFRSKLILPVDLQLARDRDRRSHWIPHRENI